MLKEIKISDFALMDNLELSLSPGFNVFTGETGAGKSNLIDAMGLAIGGRAREEYIRTGKEQAMVEAVFHIEGNLPAKTFLLEQGFDERDELLITRVISRKGKNTCRINGRLATSSILSEVGSHLIELQGQHEHQSLFKVSRHLDLLDEFCGPSLISLREKAGKKYREMKNIRKNLSELKKEYEENIRRKDFLEFEIKEIKDSHLLPEEDEKLLKEKKVLSSVEKINELLSGIFLCFEDDMGMDFFVDSILKNLREAVSMDENLNPLLERFENIFYEIQDFSGELHQYYDGLEADPERLEEVMKRLDLINKLKGKYGNSMEEILAYLEKAEKDFSFCSGSLEKIKELEEKEKKLTPLLLKDIEKLSKKRKDGSSLLKKAVCRELKEIGMEKSDFDIVFYNESQTPEQRLREKGIDDIEFLFSANPGEPLRPLVKIASGGEMSRVMLALKSALANVKFIPSLIFDEVDSGLGGEAASLVGEKLSALSSSYQVICVTHLPQIACLADTHFFLYKTELEGRAVSRIKELGEEERVEEISRMLEGEERSRASRELALKMLRLK